MRYPFPFTPTMQVLLEDMGFVKTSHPATWYDCGNAENGPKVGGGPAWDVWTLGHQAVIVSEDMVVSVDQEMPLEEVDGGICEHCGGPNMDHMGGPCEAQRRKGL